MILLPNISEYGYILGIVHNKLYICIEFMGTQSKPFGLKINSGAVLSNLNQFTFISYEDKKFIADKTNLTKLKCA